MPIATSVEIARWAKTTSKLTTFDLSTLWLYTGFTPTSEIQLTSIQENYIQLGTSTKNSETRIIISCISFYTNVHLVSCINKDCSKNIGSVAYCNHTSFKISNTDNT